MLFINILFKTLDKCTDHLDLVLAEGRPDALFAKPLMQEHAKRDYHDVVRLKRNVNRVLSSCRNCSIVIALPGFFKTHVNSPLPGHMST